MATQPMQIKCDNCGKLSSYHFQQVNHVKQFLLSVFTMGLWLPIWLFFANGKTKICDLCGKPAED